MKTVSVSGEDLDRWAYRIRNGEGVEYSQLSWPILERVSGRRRP